MRSDTATTGRVRLVIVLSVAAAVTVMVGVILVAASVVMRLLTRHQHAHMTSVGADVAVAGIAFGLVVMVVFAIARIGITGTSRAAGDAADHRQGNPPSPESREPRHGRAQERLRAGQAAAGAGRTGAGYSGGRSVRPPMLNPANVYSPGGLIDVPRDGRVPGAPAGHDVPEILRTAGPPPAAAPVGRGQDWPSAAWAGVQPPHPGYQPGVHPGGPARGPYAAGGQPLPAMPPREHMRPREAPRPGPAGPPGDSRLVGDPGSPREGRRPGAPIRPGGSVPLRGPGYPPPLGSGLGQGGEAGRHAGGPGYATAGGYPPGPGHAGSSGSVTDPEPFDGGYAKVIRASDHPGRPAPGRPPGFGPAAEPARDPDSGRLPDPARPQAPARRAAPPADIYVYRDTDGLPGDSGPASPGPDENDPAYWYDLPGTGTGSGNTGASQDSGVSDGSRGSAGTSRVLNETRGPFEPLVSSAGPPGTMPPGQEHGAGQEVIAQERKLEQIKDLYLTAEAIGETNVDKHFDQLLAHQRQLISEFFTQSGAARSAAEGQAAAEPDTGPATGPGGASEGARVAADQPRVW